MKNPIFPYVRPVMDINFKDLEKIIPAVWAAVKQFNDQDQKYFLMGGLIVRVSSAQSNTKIERVGKNQLLYLLANAIDWRKGDVSRGDPAFPPNTIVDAVLSTPTEEIPLPQLTGITTRPLFDDEGNLHDKAGYNRKTGFYYTGRSYTEPIHRHGETFKLLSDTPIKKEIEKAKNKIHELFSDFPHKSTADKHNAIALMLSPYLTPFTGRIPSHSTESPAPGTGKGLHGKACLYPAYRDTLRITSLPTDDNETRKKITSYLLEGAGCVVFDNVAGAIDSPVLAALATADTYSDRVLGSTQTVNVRNNLLTVFTANNPLYSEEQTRRIVQIRLQSDIDKPWLRDDFKIPDLSNYIERAADTLTAACLTLIRAWFQAGAPGPREIFKHGEPMPRKFKALGSFEKWSNTLVGLMHYLGFTEFLENQIEFYHTADSEGAAWKGFIELWYEQHGTTRVKGRDLFPLAMECDNLPIFGNNENGMHRSFGKALQQQKDCIFTIESVNTDTGELRNISLKVVTDGTWKGKPCYKLEMGC